jgi:nucleoside-diphosphate-sugar epimerase
MDPISLYGQLKVTAEREIMSLESENFKPTILRMATIYGLSPRMRFDLVVNILTLNAFANGKITVHGGTQWRPLVHVADAAKAYAMCLDAPLEDVGGQVFNVGSNEQNYQIQQLADQVVEVFPDVDVETIAQSPDLRDYYVSFDKINSVLGYRVEHSIADGLSEIKRALEDGEIADPSHPRHYNGGGGP